MYMNVCRSFIAQRTADGPVKNKGKKRGAERMGLAKTDERWCSLLNAITIMLASNLRVSAE